MKLFGRGRGASEAPAQPSDEVPATVDDTEPIGWVEPDGTDERIEVYRFAGETANDAFERVEFDVYGDPAAFDDEDDDEEDV